MNSIRFLKIGDSAIDFCSVFFLGGGVKIFYFRRRGFLSLQKTVFSHRNTPSFLGSVFLLELTQNRPNVAAEPCRTEVLSSTPRLVGTILHKSYLLNIRAIHTYKI
jgi:hypothetical protein